MSNEAALLAHILAPYPADVLLFHPSDPQIFLVGTYLLDEATRVRHGKICTYRIGVLDGSVSAGEDIVQMAEVDCDAVLDMKWHEQRLYVAHSTGSLSVYACEREDGFILRPLIATTALVAETVLILSLSVSSRGILTSHSDGTVATWTTELRPLATWSVSDLEVWIQAWGADDHVVYSGSDDGLLAAWDLRTATEGQAMPMFRNRKSHGAGVTAILPLESDEFGIVTGAYDDEIRRLDIRNPHKVMERANLGGGVWRIIPQGKDRLLTCCMYDGARILEKEHFGIVKRFDEHESIVYGGDVTGDMVGTCSFYDKSICIWR